MVGTKTIKTHEMKAIVSRINTPGSIPRGIPINMLYFAINIPGGTITNIPTGIA